MFGWTSCNANAILCTYRRHVESATHLHLHCQQTCSNVEHFWTSSTMAQATTSILPRRSQSSGSRLRPRLDKALKVLLSHVLAWSKLSQFSIFVDGVKQASSFEIDSALGTAVAAGFALTSGTNGVILAVDTKGQGTHRSRAGHADKRFRSAVARACVLSSIYCVRVVRAVDEAYPVNKQYRQSHLRFWSFVF
eukprot:scaffold4279_cov326-Prasinococcus_capsulatus_cf.AAC.1